ncbi:MAG: CvpA family protein [Aestuariibacter sp.]|nr:CvpA family protein [Aestuariibacter sp.]
MDWSLVIFAVVVMLYGYRGYRRGMLKSLGRVFSLSAGYTAAALYTTQVSTIIAALMPVQGFATLILASILLYFTAGAAVRTLFLVVERLLPEEDLDSTASSYAGAGIGLFSGLVIAFIMTWTIAFTRDTQPQATAEVPASNQSSDIEILARQLAGKTVNTAMSLGSMQPVLTEFSVALAENPAEVTMQAQRLANSYDLNTFISAEENQAALNSGDIEAVKKLPAFHKLIKHPDLIALSRSTGIVPQAASNRETIATVLAKHIIDIWGHIQQATNNKRTQEIIGTPEFQHDIQSGDPMQLLTNANFLELTNIYFSTAQISETN